MEKDIFFYNVYSAVLGIIYDFSYNIEKGTWYDIFSISQFSLMIKYLASYYDFSTTDSVPSMYVKLETFERA